MGFGCPLRGAKYFLSVPNMLSRFLTLRSVGFNSVGLTSFVLFLFIFVAFIGDELNSKSKSPIYALHNKIRNMEPGI